MKTIKNIICLNKYSFDNEVMLALFNKFQMSYPGGCDLGGRGLDFHYMAFTSLGYRITTNGLIEGEKISDYPHDVYFKTKINKSQKLIISALVINNKFKHLRLHLTHDYK